MWSSSIHVKSMDSVRYMLQSLQEQDRGCGVIGLNNQCPFPYFLFRSAVSALQRSLGSRHFLVVSYRDNYRSLLLEEFSSVHSPSIYNSRLQDSSGKVHTGPRCRAKVLVVEP